MDCKPIIISCATGFHRVSNVVNNLNETDTMACGRIQTKKCRIPSTCACQCNKIDIIAWLHSIDIFVIDELDNHELNGQQLTPAHTEQLNIITEFPMTADSKVVESASDSIENIRNFPDLSHSSIKPLELNTTATYATLKERDETTLKSVIEDTSLILNSTPLLEEQLLVKLVTQVDATELTRINLNQDIREMSHSSDRIMASNNTDTYHNPSNHTDGKTQIELIEHECEIRIQQLKTIHVLKEKQLSLSFMRLAAEMELENRRKIEELDIKYMEELLTQRQLTLAQATTIRAQLRQLIDYQTRLSAQQACLIEHQNSLVTCHARLSHSQAQLMHYQAQLLLHQTQFMLLQAQIMQQAAQQQQDNEAVGDLALETPDVSTSPPEP